MGNKNVNIPGTTHVIGSISVDNDVSVKEGSFKESLGNVIGTGKLYVDAAVFRNSTTGVLVGSLKAGSTLVKVEWIGSATNLGRSVNVGTDLDRDKFVDNQAMGTSGSANVDLLRTSLALNVRADAANTSDDPVDIYVGISSTNGAQRGALVIYFTE